MNFVAIQKIVIYMKNIYITSFLFVFFVYWTNGSILAQETVRDNFSSVSYSNNNGTQNWSSNWIESNDDSSSSSGRIRISGSRLRFEDITRNSHQIKRSADINGATSATLSFDWEAVGLDRQNNNNKEQLDVQVSVSATGTFTTIGTLDGNQSDSFSVDVSAYISSEITIRFINTSTWQYGDWESGEYVYIDNLQISYVSPTAYCNSSGNTDWETSITLVNFNTINNTSSKSSGYDDYTSQSTDVVAGSDYDLTVNLNTHGNWIVYSMVWIDWNQDFDFDDSGEAYDLGSATNVSDGATNSSPLSITIPVDAIVGNTRMRVSAKYNDYPSTCETDFDGEVEDYTINVVSSSVPTITSFIPGNACSNSSQVITITGTNFTGATAVSFNGVAAASYTVSSDTQITATLPALATSGAISVTNADGTATSTGDFTVNPLPAAAGNITGTDIVLPGDTKTYVCAAITDATSYEWTISGDGASITNNGTQADVQFDSDASPGDRTLTVKGVNSCGDGTASTYNIYVRPTYACQTTIVNWDFDSPDLNGLDWKGYSTVNGWSSSLNNIEIWRNGFMGITTPDGGQFSELNSIGQNEIWQDLTTTPGARMRWAITYRYRSSSSESVRLKIGAVGALVDITDISNNNGDGWVVHSGFYIVPAGQTTTQFRIASLNSGSASNLIDNIQFYPIEVDVEKPTFDSPADSDGDGFVVSECVDATNLVVNNIDVSNLADNCTPVDNLVIEYTIVKEDGTILVNYGDDPTGAATSSDASGYSFPLGINTVTYRVKDEAGNSESSIIKIAIHPDPSPIGIYYD